VEVVLLMILNFVGSPRIADEFGRVGRTQKPFRLGGGIAEITAFHEHSDFDSSILSVVLI
jgi:hypothetical protein